jgi:hypothetical protein
MFRGRHLFLATPLTSKRTRKHIKINHLVLVPCKGSGKVELILGTAKVELILGVGSGKVELILGALSLVRAQERWSSF